MSKHTDTGRAGKKLWILIPVIAVLIIAAALVWLNSVYVYAGGLHRRDSAQIDLRGKSISAERYLRLREQLPDCKIYWDVPIGGAVIDCESTAIVLTSLKEEDVARLAFFPALAELDLTAADVSPERFDAVRAAYPALSVRWSIPIGASRYPSDAESITLTDFTVSELPLFDYFTALRSADARGCACYDALLALREKYPALELEWQVPLGSTEYLESATEIAVDDISITPDALREALRYLPEAQTVSFPACPWSEAEKNALRAEFPAVAFVWPVAIFGDTYPSDTAELSFAGRTFSEADVAELSEKLASLPKLTRVDLTGTGVTVEQMTPVCEKYPAVDFVFTFELYGVPISTEDTLLDFTGIEMESTEPVESILPVMHKLEKVDMSDCGFSDEEMDALNKKYENVRFVWTLHITHYNIRTDTTYFRASSRYYGYFTNETIKKLAYCPDMIALDLGHRPIEDLSFLYQMPDLKYLVLLDCHALDPLADRLVRQSHLAGAQPRLRHQHRPPQGLQEPARSEHHVYDAPSAGGHVPDADGNGQNRARVVQLRRSHAGGAGKTAGGAPGHRISRRVRLGTVQRGPLAVRSGLLRHARCSRPHVLYERHWHHPLQDHRRCPVSA